MSTNTASDHESAVRQLTDTDAFNLLSEQRRRHVLDCLDSEGPTTVSELAAWIADRTGEPWQTVRTSLHHVHLPKLEDYGAIERNGNTVRLGPVAPELRRHRVTNRT